MIGINIASLVFVLYHKYNFLSERILISPGYRAFYLEIKYYFKARVLVKNIKPLWYANFID